MANRWSVEVKRCYIESKTKKTKKGEPTMFPVDIRKLHIFGDFLQTDWFQVFLMKRPIKEKVNGKWERTGTEYLYSVKYLAFNIKPKWPSDLLDKKEERKWKKEGTYTEVQFLKWLVPYMRDTGTDAAGVLSEFKTSPPENIAA